MKLVYKMCCLYKYLLFLLVTFLVESAEHELPRYMKA
jgi:hypothetical protein